MNFIKKFLVAATLVLALTFGGCATSHHVNDPFDVMYEIKPGVIHIEGVVSGPTFKAFYNQTLDTSTKSYRVVIDTNGGDGFATTGIVSRMAELQANGVSFTTETYSKAFSAGFFIFVAGDKRIMHQGAQLMAHTALGQRMYQKAAPYGHVNTRDYQLSRIDDNIVRFTLGRVGTPTNRMALETMMKYSGMIFIDADDARTLGLLTEYINVN